LIRTLDDISKDIVQSLKDSFFNFENKKELSKTQPKCKFPKTSHLQRENVLLKSEVKGLKNLCEVNIILL